MDKEEKSLSVRQEVQWTGRGKATGRGQGSRDPNE